MDERIMEVIPVPFRNLCEGVNFAPCNPIDIDDRIEFI